MEYPYRQSVELYSGIGPLRSLAGFDGAQYLIIADHGGYFEYQQAYFPLYPLVVRMVSTVWAGNMLYAALTIGLLSLGGVLFLLPKIISMYPKISHGKALSPYVLLLLPGSFFLVSVYTEGFFLLLFCGTLLLIEKRRYGLAGFFSVLLGMTRFIGVFVTIPILIHLVYPYITRKGLQVRKFVSSLRPVTLFLLLAPLLGLALYMGYLYVTKGDPLAFIHAQKAFNNNRSTSIIWLPQVLYRYARILITARFDVIYLVALGELGVFGLYISLLIHQVYRFWKQGASVHWMPWGINLFSIANMLLPTLSGTLSSIPRYGLLSLGVMIECMYLPRTIRNILLVCLLVVNICMVILFCQGYFVS